MGLNSVTTSVLSLFTLSATLVVLCGVVASADLGYNCYFGEMITSTSPDGQVNEFCPTQTQPPFMNKGDYLVALKEGRCYECMCAADTGLACCECHRPRRG